MPPVGLSLEPVASAGAPPTELPVAASPDAPLFLEASSDDTICKHFLWLSIADPVGSPRARSLCMFFAIIYMLIHSRSPRQQAKLCKSTFILLFSEPPESSTLPGIQQALKNCVAQLNKHMRNLKPPKDPNDNDVVPDTCTKRQVDGIGYDRVSAALEASTTPDHGPPILEHWHTHMTRDLGRHPAQHDVVAPPAGLLHGG